MALLFVDSQAERSSLLDHNSSGGWSPAVWGVTRNRGLIRSDTTGEAGTRPPQFNNIKVTWPHPLQFNSVKVTPEKPVEKWEIAGYRAPQI